MEHLRIAPSGAEEFTIKSGHFGENSPVVREPQVCFSRSSVSLEGNEFLIELRNVKCQKCPTGFFARQPLNGKDFMVLN